MAGSSCDIDDPETLARLLFDALTRGAMLIAVRQSAATRDRVARTIRALLTGLAPGASADLCARAVGVAED